MANKYTKVGTIWKGKPNANGEMMPNTIQFTENFVPKAGAWYQCHSKPFKEADLANKIAKGWIKEENVEAATTAVKNMSDKVYADLIEVLKTE